MSNNHSDAMSKIADYAMTYPELEGELRYLYASRPWNDPARIRYQNYCCIIHNSIIEQEGFFSTMGQAGRYLDSPGVRELLVLHYTFFSSDDHRPFLNEESIAILESVREEAMARRETELRTIGLDVDGRQVHHV